MSFVRKLADGAPWRRGDASPDDPAAVPGSGRAGQTMRFARALIGELVDKKLWPVALLLCAAIIVIPVLMTRGAGSDDDAAAPAALPQGDVAAANIFEPIGPPSAKARPGGQLDPFRQPATKKSKPRSMPVGGGTSSLGPPSGGTSSGGPSSGDPLSGGTPFSAATPKRAVPAADVYYRTAVRWYETDAGKPVALARLTALGGLAEPGVLYLGVRRSADVLYAVFVLGLSASSEGEGSCQDATTCRIVRLKAGEARIVTLASSDGSVTRQFTLEAVVIKAVAPGVGEARTARAKVHPDGRDALRDCGRTLPPPRRSPR